MSNKPPHPQRVVALGECMLELQSQGFGPAHLAWGGDSYNTAVYLRRCSAPEHVQVAYATGLGDDSLSQSLLEQWAAQGLDLSLVRRVPGRMPGLYLIETDPQGERRFHFWRQHSAARAYFDGSPSPLEQAAAPDALYLTGISLAILAPEARARLWALAQGWREQGTAIVFDNNYRPRLWTDVHEAREVFAQALDLATLAFITLDDHQALWGVDADTALAQLADLPCPERVVKRGAASTLLRTPGDAQWQEVPTEAVARVVDTTAAGDSFAAAYMARRLMGASAEEAAAFGNRLAARVIQHRGALIPPEAMLDLMPGGMAAETPGSGASAPRP